MTKFKFPLNLPVSKEEYYVRTINNKYDKLLSLLYNLGGLCTYDQVKRIYMKYHNSLAESYAQKKVQMIIKDLEKMKLIGTDNINTYKIIYLKKFAYAIVTGDYNTNVKLNLRKQLKDSNLKVNLLIVEYFITHNEIITLAAAEQQLLKITNDIFNAKKKDFNLPYDLKLLTQILKDKDAKNCLDKIKDLPEDNLIRILWIDIYTIFNNLRLQRQPIAITPFYIKLYKKDNSLTLHYVPQIIIFDVHNKEYYSEKINNLFYKFYNITSNHTRDMQSNFKEKGSLGWEGYNHIAYVLKIIGYNEKELLQKQKFINSYIKDNPNGILLTNCEIEYIDISKYFTHSSRKHDNFINIDSEFDKLIQQKLNSI